MRHSMYYFILGLSLLGSSSVFAAAPISTLDVGEDSTGSAESMAAVSSVQSKPADISISLTPDERLARLENQVQYLTGQNAKIDNLTSEIEALRGRMEELNYQLTLAKKQITDLQQAQTTAAANSTSDALNNTPSAVTAPAAATAPVAAPNATPVNAGKKIEHAPAASPQENAAFDKAYQLLVNKQYSGAIIDFNNFLNKYPQSAKVALAHYWLGDLYLAEGKPDNASMQYRAVIKLAPNEKVPDAMLKLGSILAAYGDSAHAKQLFQSVIKRYPGTVPARQALQKLKEIN